MGTLYKLNIPQKERPMNFNEMWAQAKTFWEDSIKHSFRPGRIFFNHRPTDEQILFLYSKMRQLQHSILELKWENASKVELFLDYWEIQDVREKPKKIMDTSGHFVENNAYLTAESHAIE